MHFSTLLKIESEVFIYIIIAFCEKPDVTLNHVLATKFTQLACSCQRIIIISHFPIACLMTITKS